MLPIQIELRRKILSMHKKANAGHIGSSLSCIDILISIFQFIQKKEETFILSKGHGASALYAILNFRGEISDPELESFYKDNTALPAHPAALKFQSIPFATGSLGHGFPIATGIAKANKLLGNNLKSYVLISDGETNEGTTWEAAHFAVQNQLNNLIVIIDKNGLQGFGKTNEVLGDTSKLAIWISLGFEVVEISGHDISLINTTIDKLNNSNTGKPKLIIANTVKGKGVSFMENKLEWHYLPMSDEQYTNAISQLEID